MENISFEVSRIEVRLPLVNGRRGSMQTGEQTQELVEINQGSMSPEISVSALSPLGSKKQPEAPDTFRMSPVSK